MVLNLKDPGVARVRRTHPLLQGKKPFARGSFSAVFDGTQPDRVLKLTVDSLHYCYLTDYCTPQGPHKPVVHQDFDDVGETADGQALYLVEVERLNKLPVGNPYKRLLGRVIRWYTRNGRHYLPDEDTDFKGLPKTLASFFADLNVFVDNYGANFDPKVGNNFLLRPADDTLVVNDPIFDRKAYERYHRSRQHERGGWPFAVA